MFAGILWRFLILETFVVGALCCDNCDDVHPQTRFCDLEFVLKVKLLEEIKTPGLKMFSVEIKQVFKGDLRVLEFIQNRYVLKMNDTCPDQRWKPGNVLLIFGDSKTRTIHTDMCYGNMLWEKTTIFDRRALTYYYKRNCDCSPEPNYITKQKACISKYSFMRNWGTGCKWVKTPYFRLCEKGLLNDTKANEKRTIVIIIQH